MEPNNPTRRTICRAGNRRMIVRETNQRGLSWSERAWEPSRGAEVWPGPQAVTSAPLANKLNLSALGVSVVVPSPALRRLVLSRVGIAAASPPSTGRTS